MLWSVLAVLGSVAACGDERPDPDEDGDDAAGGPSGAATGGATSGNAGRSGATGASSGAQTGGAGGEGGDGDAGANGGTGGTPNTGGSGAEGGSSPGGSGNQRGGTSGMGGAAGTSLGGAGASGSAGASGAAGTSGTGGVGGVTGNLITNGDFSQGELDWHITDAQGNPVMASLMDGAYCVYTGNTSNVGWPDVPAKAISLEPGATYTLSFRTRGGYSNAQARFGLAAPPYTPIFMSDWFYQPDASGSWTPRTYQFSATGSEASGLVFTVNFASGSSFICFDDVVLVKN